MTEKSSNFLVSFRILLKKLCYINFNALISTIFSVALKWLRKHREKFSPCSRVLFADFGDVLYQSDPFSHFDSVGADVILSEEFRYGPGTLESKDMVDKIDRKSVV